MCEVLLPRIVRVGPATLNISRQAAAMHLFFRALIVLFAVVISSQVFSQDAKTNAAKNLDYSLVGQSGYANPLNLTDQQRSEIANLLEERLQSLVSSEPSERKNIIKESNESIAALLSDEQKQALKKWSIMTPEQRKNLVEKYEDMKRQHLDTARLYTEAGF